jgi:hypothetical protein
LNESDDPLQPCGGEVGSGAKSLRQDDRAHHETFGATLLLFVGGYLLLNANGVFGAMVDRTHGWDITPLPSHPISAIVAYLVAAIGLQLAAASLVMPGSVQTGTTRFWSRYAATVAACIGSSLIAAFVIAFVVMALLDAGKI